MGAWGFGVLQDDTALDVRADYLKHFNGGRGREETLRRLKHEYAGCMGDPDEEPVFWLAVAACEWECGQLSKPVLTRVRRIVQRGLGLDRWAAEGPTVLRHRRARLAAFLKSIEEPNPKPRVPRPAIKRKPVFEPGDCLGVRKSNGRYGAVLVLDGDPESSDPGVETFGVNVVGVLEYDSARKPGPTVFEGRKWAVSRFQFRTKGPPDLEFLSVARSGFRAVRDRIEVVGRTRIRKSDPREPRVYTDWKGFLE